MSTYDDLPYYPFDPFEESPEHPLCPDCERLLSRAVSVIERLERELRRPRVPEKKDHERVLEWLASVCGGPAALAQLDATPLTEEGLDLPVVEEAAPRQRLEAVADLLDGTAERFFDREAALAFRRALLRVWGLEPLAVDGPRPASQVAAGIAWAVGEANGLVGPKGLVTATRLKQHFGVTRPPSAYAGPVVQALRGFWPWHAAPLWGVHGVPEITPLGYADLLLSSTRAQLVRLRDRAEAARAADVPQEGSA